MASSNQKKAPSPVMKYKSRAGTSNKGKEYEYKLTALLCLRSIQLKLEEMWIASNIEGVDKMDDIILHLKKSSCPPITYMLQLKHMENPKNIQEWEFSAKKGGFVLSKYFQDIENIKNSVNSRSTSNVIKKLGTMNDINFVLFTNRGVDECELLNKQINISLTDLDITPNGEEYKFDFTNLPAGVSFTQAVANANLFLFSNQFNVQQVSEEITKEMKKIVNLLGVTATDAESVAKGFTAHLEDWHSGHLGEPFFFTKENILYKLTELFLNQYTFNPAEKPFAFYKDKENLIWDETIESHAITLIEYSKTSLQFLIQFLRYKVQQYSGHDFNNWEEQSSQRQFQTDIKDYIIQIVGNSGNMNHLHIYKALWRIKELPLLLKVSNEAQYRNILNILKFSDYLYKVVIFYKKFTPPNVATNIFKTLKDVNPSARDKILKQKIKIQGRPGAILTDLVTENMFQYIKCQDILNIICNNFNIGCNFESCPNYFVNRTIIKTVIKPSILNNHKEEIFLIRGQFESLDLIQTYEIFESKNIDFSRPQSIPGIINIEEDLNTDQLETLKMQKKPIYELSCYNKNYFYLKRCSHFNKIITDNMIQLSCPLKEETANTLLQTVTIIEAVPGMGKTTLLNYVARCCSVDKWVLKIDLEKHQSYFNRNCKNLNIEAEEHLTNFFHAIYKKKSKLCQQVFQHLLISKQVVVLLDGFDEIADSYAQEVINISKSLIQKGYQICITTRPFMKQYLEKIFQTTSDTIKPFTKNDQRTFLRNYFNATHNPSKETFKSNLINEFIQKLILGARENLNDRDAEFTGIPLQTKFLAVTFNEKCKQFINNNGASDFSLDFDLVSLYEAFVENKKTIYLEKYAQSQIKLYNCIEQEQSLFALQWIFPETFFREISIINQLKTSYARDKKKKQQLEQLGIISLSTDDNTIRVQSCIHRTVAEYLSAQWLIEYSTSSEKELRVLAHNLIKTRFSQNYEFLFYIFDKIATRGCSLHQSIINKKLSEAVDIITNDTNSVNQIDKMGRNVLQIIALNSSRYETPFTKNKILFNEDDRLKLIREMTLNISTKCDTSDKLGYTAVDYALANNSLEAANIIQQKLNTSIISASLNLNLKLDYLNCCADNFTSLLILLLKYFMSRDLILNYIDKYCTIEEYLKELPHNSAIQLVLHQYNSTNALQLLKSEWSDYSGYTQCLTDSYYKDLRYAVALTSENYIKNVLPESSEMNDQDIEGNTLLHYAVLHHKTENMHLLLQNGAKINKQNNDGNTPLHLAILKFNLDIVKILVYITDVKIKNKNGNNALHLISQSQIASADEHRSIAKLMINKSTVNAKNIKGETPLHLAASCGFENIGKLIITEGGALEATNNAKETPLHSASLKGYKELVTLLINNKGNINASNYQGRTPLHLASLHGHIDIVELIVNKEVDINVKTIYSGTPLLLASLSGHKDIVELLIDKGANINAKNYQGRTPLHLASLMGHKDVAELLINKGVDINIRTKYKGTPLHLASLNGHEDIVELIISKKGDINAVNYEGRHPLHLASLNGHTDIVRLIITKGGKVNHKSYTQETPLHLASLNGHKNVVKLLIDELSQINAKTSDGMTPLHLSSLKGHTAVVNLIISNGGDVNGKSNDCKTPLHLASLNGHEDVALIIIDNGGKTNIQNNEGNTPLHLAALNGHTNVTKLLIDKGSHINEKNKEGLMPLHLASLTGHSDLVTLIITKGGDINGKNSEGLTSLHLASLNGHKNVVKLLIDNQSPINEKNNEGSTPLHLASLNGHENVVELIILKEGDINAKNNEGKTALNLASLNGHDNIAELIEEYTTHNIVT